MFLKLRINPDTVHFTTFPIPFPYLSYTFPIPFPYSPHTLLILSSYSPHTLLILSSYTLHTLFIHSSYTPHALLIHSSYSQKKRIPIIESFILIVFFYLSVLNGAAGKSSLFIKLGLIGSSAHA